MELKNNIKLGRQQLWLTPDDFEEGISYAKSNDIKDLFLWYGKDTTKNFFSKELTLDFSWFEELPNIISIEMMLKLTAKSNLESLYSLPNLERLVYFCYDKLPLKHERLTNLKWLYTHYSKKHLHKQSSFESLENLSSLKLWHIKQNDCTFLGNLSKLEQLELTWSRTLQSLSGIEKFKELKRLGLKNLYALANVEQLNECAKLLCVKLDGCKHISEQGKLLVEKINKSE